MTDEATEKDWHNLQLGNDRVERLAMSTDSRVTGVFVRALDLNGKWVSVDAAFLDKESFDFWIKSRGEVSEWALDFMHIVLGYDRDIV